MKIIRIAVDETYQELLLTALMEKTVARAGTPAEKSCRMLYGDVKEAIAEAKEISVP